jgi:FkbM family methyltransferase
MNIKQFIQNLPIETFVEIGTHFGTDTQDFRKMHPQARIVCFEPDPRNIKMIKKLGNDKICELYEFAVSNTNKPMNFYLSSGDSRGKTENEILNSQDWSCSSSLKKPTGHLLQHKWVTFPTSVKVNCTKLDDFEPLKNTKIDFMWVDVQGAEDLVFSCAEETLKNTHYVYTEFSNYELYEGQLNQKKLMKFFKGYRIVSNVCPEPHPQHGGDILLENMNEIFTCSSGNFKY